MVSIIPLFVEIEGVKISSASSSLILDSSTVHGRLSPEE